MRPTLTKITIASMSAGLWLASAAPTNDSATHAKFTAEYLKSPMIFELNEGQSDPQVKALARGSGYGLYLTSDESVFVLDAGTKNASVVRVRTEGSNPTPQISGVDPLSSISNYYLGKDQSKWRKNVANFARVKYASIYPGVDLIYYGNQQQLEYDYVVAPGADPNSIRLAIEGTRTLHLDRNGDLLLETSHGSIRQHRPVIYQEVNGVRREISGNFLVRGNHVSFRVGDYDHSKDLVIDPSIAFVTYVGGSGTDQGLSIQITDATGFTIVAGSTASANFPIVPVPACPASPICTSTGVTSYPYTGETDGFIAIFSTHGSELLNSTFVGGTGGVNVITSIALDNFEIPRFLYVGGYTTSPNFDVVNAEQPTLGGETDGFLAQIVMSIPSITFVPPGGTLNTTVGFATYLGGSAVDEITSIAIEPHTEDIFVTGFTSSTNFPTTKGVLQRTNAGGEDAFVARFASGCSTADNAIDGCAVETTPAGTLLFSTYLGGTGNDAAKGIAVYYNASTGGTNAYICGSTTSTTLNGPMESGATEATSTPSSGFLVSMTGHGTSLAFSNLIGTTSGKTTSANAVTTDVNGIIYVTGNTNDSALPTVRPVQGAYKGGGNDAFVAAYGSGGKASFLSYFGGAGDDVANAIGVCIITSESTPDCTAASGGTSPVTNVFIAGSTSGQLPIVNATGLQGTYGGGSSDGFVAMFTSTNGAHFTEGYSTYIGGPGSDIIYGLAVGSSGNARFTGITSSTSGLATTGAYQTTNAGGYDAFAGQIQTTP